MYFLTAGDYVLFDVPQSLEDGEYKLKLFYSTDGGVNYDHQVQPAYYDGKELYDRMLVADGTAYFMHRFLSGYYGVGSFVMPVGVKVNDNISVDVNLSYMPAWTPEYEIGPTGNVYLALLKDGVEVATGPMNMVSLPYSSSKTYQMQLTAPSEWGRYDLVLNDESGTHMLKGIEFTSSIVESDLMSIPVFILPSCQELVEDFETMTANNSTTDQDVQGRFTTWTFSKSGVRAPGEGKCNGTNAVMMKRPSLFQTTKPLNKDFFMAQAVFFNPTATLSKYTLEYSTDGGTTWQMAYTIDSIDVVEVDKKSKALATWNLNLSASQSTLFRIAMIGGGNGATYVDDFALFYHSLEGDVNGDGEVNIADVNAVIRVILTDEANDAADVNGDGEVNISDVNTIIHHILE